MGHDVFDVVLDVVQGQGKGQALHADIGGFGVHQTDQLALAVEQAAAGIAAVDGGVGLHHGKGLIVDGDLPLQGGDDARGDGAAQLAQGIADGHHRGAHLELVGIAHDGRGQALGLHFDDGDVLFLVAADHSGVEGLSLPGGHGDGVGVFDHVIAGEDVAVFGEDDAGSRALAHVGAGEEIGIEIVAHDLGGDLHHGIGGQVGNGGHVDGFVAGSGLGVDRAVEHGGAGLFHVGLDVVGDLVRHLGSDAFGLEMRA